jgi:hypothetical protein
LVFILRRIVTSENVERLREAFDGFLAHEREWGADLLHPDVVWDATDSQYAHLYTFKDGLIVHWKLYESQDEALRAAGVSP